MDKYAVELDNSLVKLASKGGNCPKCGRLLHAKDGASGAFVPPQYCPDCGTEPFEKRPEPSRK